MNGINEDRSSHSSSRKPETHRSHHNKDAILGSELWTDGLICAFEFIGGHRKSVRPKSHSRILSNSRVDAENAKNQIPSSGGTEPHVQRRNMKNLIESADDVGLDENADRLNPQLHPCRSIQRLEGSHWVPIGWTRISELLQTVQVDAGWSMQQFELMDDEDDLTVADVAAPYWERQAGPVWWCHVAAGNPSIDAWLNSAQWLHPDISIALRDESRLISDRMKHLLYEVPVRVAGGLLFELLGQSAGDPYVDEDDIPIVLRSWQAQSFLITALHVKGSAPRTNVLGITEVQELLLAGGYNTPRTAHEVIAHLATRLARWDDRLFRKYIFGAADEVELKFMNRRNHEDLNLFGIILNQEIRKLSTQSILLDLHLENFSSAFTWKFVVWHILPHVMRHLPGSIDSGIISLMLKNANCQNTEKKYQLQVIRVKWSLHAREEIVFELLQHLRGNTTRYLLEGIRKSTREMIEEQEAVRGRLFTIQDVMQSTIRAWLQDRSLRVTHNLSVFGGGGLILTIITGLFGINVDGIPGAENTPYAFGLFSGLLVFLGVVLIAAGFLYFGLKSPVSEEQVEVRKLELQELVKMFQDEAETHAQVRKPISRHTLSPTAGDYLVID